MNLQITIFLFYFDDFSHILELGQSFREQLSSEPWSTARGVDSISNQLSEKTQPWNEDERGRESDFEKRLQFAMEQSLLLQESQMKDIERLQEELGEDQRETQPRSMTVSRSSIVEKIRKPLKGILKKPSRYVERYYFTIILVSSKQEERILLLYCTAEVGKKN